MAGTWPSARRRPSVPSPEYFSLEQPRLKIFRRAGAPAPIPVGRVLSMGPLTRPARRQNAPAAATARSLGSSTQPAVREASSSHHAARLLDRLSTGTLTVDRGYHIRSINPSARHLLGIHTTAIGEDLIHRMDPALSDRCATLSMRRCGRAVDGGLPHAGSRHGRRRT